VFAEARPLHDRVAARFDAHHHEMADSRDVRRTVRCAQEAGA
jgi:hypothetical protein